MKDKKVVIIFDNLHLTWGTYKFLHKFFDVRCYDAPQGREFTYNRADLEQNKRVWAIFCPFGYNWGLGLTKIFPNLKYLVSATTTTPHIETDDGVEVISLAGERILRDVTSTAEHTLGLIMALHRRIPAAHIDAVDMGNWNRWSWGAPRMLSKLTLGIIGNGRVGEQLRRISGELFTEQKNGRGEPFPSHTWTDRPGNMAVLEDKYKLIRDSDIIAICATHTTGDKPLFDVPEFKMMKKGALLINTSRPEVLNHHALLNMLTNGGIRGAALDCLEDEHLAGANPFRHAGIASELRTYARTHSNLIITPHIAGSTEDAWQMTQMNVCERLLEKANG